MSSINNALDSQVTRLLADSQGKARAEVKNVAWGKDGTVGFFGVTPVSKPAALTGTPAVAPSGGVGSAAGGWDTAANRDAAIATINALKTRVDELESRLRSLGLLT